MTSAQHPDAVRVAAASTHELLEREECLAAIGSTLAGARSGGGRLLLIEGPPGIGKTALLDETERRAAGLRVVRASGGELEVDLPLGAVRQLFEPVLRRASGSERARWSRGAGEIAGRLLAEAGASVRAGATVDAAAVRSSVYWLAVALAEDEPLAVLIDDLQWVDGESLRWVLFAARRLRDTGIALIVSTRERRPGGGESVLDVLRGLPDASLLRLAPLSPRATAQLVGTWSGSGRPAASFAATCHRLSGGNPFLLTQLLREAGRVGVRPDSDGAARLGTLAPEGIARAVLRRLRASGGAAVQLARAVAVLGAGANLVRAAELAELPFEEAASEADVLIRADVARDAERLEIAHPLVRAAVLGELTSVARAALHARAARLLAADGASPETVGAHLLAAPRGRDPWVVDRLVAAAERARGAGAPEAAARLLQRALDEPPPDGARAAIHAALGSALCTAGDARGIDHITIARELTSDASQRVMLGVRLGTPYLFLGRGEEVAAMLREALAEAGHGDPFTAFLIRAGQASAPMFGARFDPRELTAELLEEVRHLEPLPLLGRPAVGGLAMVACTAAFPAAGTAATARLAIGDLEDHRAAIAEGFPLLPALLALGLAGDVDGLAERLALVEDGVRRRGAIALGLCVLLCTRAALDLHEGAIDGALAHASAAAEVSAESQFSVPRAQSLVLLAAALRERGDLHAAELALADRPPDAAGGMWAAAARGERAALALARGDPATATQEALAAGDLADRIGVVNPVIAPWRSVAARALKTCGEDDRAAALSTELLAHARAFGTSAAIGSALRVHALVLDELELLEQAERTLAGARARLEHARALIDLGAALRRDGRRVRARDPLFAGMDQARRCGSPPLVERALTELRAAGARPRTVVRSGLDALTPSELRIAQHAARGHTNREIAAELFVTNSTVETHLRSVFRKLDVSARAELGERLAGSTTSFPR